LLKNKVDLAVLSEDFNEIDYVIMLEVLQDPNLPKRRLPDL